MSPTRPTPSFSSRIVYKDQGNAVKYAEMAFGNGLIQIGSEWENIRAPSSLGGVNTQTITVHLEGGIDKHCEQARVAGGKVIEEPADQFHGDRTYRVMDPEGHVWAFSQKLREVTIEEMEAAIPGMKVWKRQSADPDTDHHEASSK